MFVRFVRSQKKLLKLYYADKETGGNNWYYFLEQSAKKMKKYRRKSINDAMIHIRMEKYRSYCSCYGDKEGSRLVSDFYDVIRNNITKKETFARHEMSDFGLLLCYENEEKLKERVENILKMVAEKRSDIKLYFKAGIHILDQELPIDVVKLDAEFFRGNDKEGKGKVIVSDAISLAKKLNMRIVAEGIETRTGRFPGRK